MTRAPAAAGELDGRSPDVASAASYVHSLADREARVSK
jgi:hypothetical protein